MSLLSFKSYELESSDFTCYRSGKSHDSAITANRLWESSGCIWSGSSNTLCHRFPVAWRFPSLFYSGWSFSWNFSTSKSTWSWKSSWKTHFPLFSWPFQLCDKKDSNLTTHELGTGWGRPLSRKGALLASPKPDFRFSTTFDKTKLFVGP